MENEEVERIPRGKNVWAVAAGGLVVFLTGLLVLITLALALGGCATTRAYVGPETTVNYREEFVQWEKVGEIMVKRIFIDNPYNRAVRVKLDCETPIGVTYEIPPHSTKIDSVFDTAAGANRPACIVMRWEFI